MREPRAFLVRIVTRLAILVRIVTRLAIDRLRRLGTLREAYVGPWLPEAPGHRLRADRARHGGRTPARRARPASRGGTPNPATTSTPPSGATSRNAPSPRPRAVTSTRCSPCSPPTCAVGDSGGKPKAPLRILESADKVGRFLFAVAHGQIPDLEVRFMELNGGPAVLLLSGGKRDSVFQVDVRDGAIQCVYIIRNPDKLAALSGE